MEQRFDLGAEMERRSLGPVELSRAAKVSRSAIMDVRRGRPPRAATRRKLLLALGQFAPLEEPAPPRPASTDGTDPRAALEALAARRANTERREQLERLRESP